MPQNIPCFIGFSSFVQIWSQNEGVKSPLNFVLKIPFIFAIKTRPIGGFPGCPVVRTLELPLPGSQV